jgi:prevent-host-death family protein
MVAIIMATITVGIRELKNHAPQLVKRAARGERIVITRYGKPHAVLAPAVAVTDETGHRARMEAWQRERRAFERLKPAARQRLAGRYVALWRGRIVDADVDHQRLFERVWKRLRGATFFIGRVGASAPTVEMPGFVLE